jgi:universal stress protein E
MIPNLAQFLHANVVVMGAVSRSALERAVIGHTAERVLDALDCDVLVIKPPGFPG